MVCAVIATTGVFTPRDRSARVAECPSSLGICTSIRIASNGRCSLVSPGQCVQGFLAIGRQLDFAAGTPQQERSQPLIVWSVFCEEDSPSGKSILGGAPTLGLMGLRRSVVVQRSPMAFVLVIRICFDQRETEASDCADARLALQTQ